MQGETVFFHSVLNDNFEVFSYLNTENMLTQEVFLEDKSKRFGATPLLAAVVLNRLSMIPLFIDKLPASTKDTLRPLLASGRTLAKFAASKGFASLLDFASSEGAADLVAGTQGNDTKKAFELLTSQLDITKFQQHYQDHVKYLGGFKDLGQDFDHDGYRLVPADDAAGGVQAVYDLFAWSYNQVASSVGGSSIPTSYPETAGSGDGRQALHHHGPQ